MRTVLCGFEAREREQDAAYCVRVGAGRGDEARGLAGRRGGEEREGDGVRASGGLQPDPARRGPSARMTLRRRSEKRNHALDARWLRHPERKPWVPPDRAPPAVRPFFPRPPDLPCVHASPLSGYEHKLDGKARPHDEGEGREVAGLERRDDEGVGAGWARRGERGRVSAGTRDNVRKANRAHERDRAPCTRCGRGRTSTRQRSRHGSQSCGAVRSVSPGSAASELPLSVLCHSCAAAEQQLDVDRRVLVRLADDFERCLGGCGSARVRLDRQAVLRVGQEGVASMVAPAVEAVQEPVACAIEELGQRRNGAAHVGEEKLALAA